jgi:hypothetical protein
MASLKKILFLVASLFYFSVIIPCDCENIPALSLNYTNKQELIFHGHISKISECRDGIGKASFTIINLYKGISTEKIDLYFDCGNECDFKFSEGEQWIIYANFEQVGKPKVFKCSRSRKLIENEAKVKSLYVEEGLSFDEELEFLDKNFSKKTFLAKNENAELSHRNQIPIGNSRIVLILVSLLGLLLIYFIIHKKLK